ncbi:MAG: dihydrodipicolinate synthase family protein [Pseudotabrizicola sp.]|uniref:dihydrodipicolinate synthase family protein n=1 Tax=Pseudotabrizicola sp. TaxID=2939647 RepID=UPI0027300663|nr:dihydrodipicolinate synthase family protein [Pseudotabrizicola sp.]MDP2082472.1 dihydrodipicolinate synthase family protein [Pseudotabrizicola sp.]MDZ7572778.1 dihydrodipicolinate synthase family protein [Pseudotabrizicola sp.]
MTLPVTGVYCAAATPVKADLSPDLAAFTAHCHQLLTDGCDGVALLGTTGEANSFGLAERRALLEAAIEAGLPPTRLMPGTGVNAAPETIDLTRHALALGVNRVVMLPPSYYKGVSDEGLFRAYAQIIETIADSRLQIILYHIPQISGVPISHDLIARLVAVFPETVVGIKDSAGKLDNMLEIIARFPGFSVLAGADPLLLPLMKAGGAGCITATSNLVGADLATVFKGANDIAMKDAVAAAQSRINANRDLSNSYTQLPAIKAMIASRYGQVGWTRLRPPLVSLTSDELADLRGRLLAIGGTVKEFAQ